MATITSTASSTVTSISLVHPLASLQPDEIIRAREIVLKYNAPNEIRFKVIAVKEPPKEQVVRYHPSFPPNCRVKRVFRSVCASTDADWDVVSWKLNMLGKLPFHHPE